MVMLSANPPPRLDFLGRVWGYAGGAVLGADAKVHDPNGPALVGIRKGLEAHSQGVGQRTTRMRSTLQPELPGAGHPPPNVGRRLRVPLGQGRRSSRLTEISPNQPADRGPVVPRTWDPPPTMRSD